MNRRCSTAPLRARRVQLVRIVREVVLVDELSVRSGISVLQNGEDTLDEDAHGSAYVETDPKPF